VRLRPAIDADDAFCFHVYEASLREYVEPIYGWDADIQRSHHAEWFEPDRLSIIEEGDGTAIGVLDAMKATTSTWVGSRSCRKPRAAVSVRL
jgi:hypothetical protein